ncbi:MAG: hypothetical protein FGM37_07060 [Phycisphaerales bacterium]|nr:hypothetical protein [Phycisphaerales bacterium]
MEGEARPEVQLSIDYIGDGHYALFRTREEHRTVERVARRVQDLFRTVALRWGTETPIEMSFAAHLAFQLETGLPLDAGLDEHGHPTASAHDGALFEVPEHEADASHATEATTGADPAPAGESEDAPRDDGDGSDRPQRPRRPR